MSTTDISEVVSSATLNSEVASTANKPPNVGRKRKGPPYKGNNKRFARDFKQPKTNILAGVTLRTYFQIYTNNDVRMWSLNYFKVLTAADNYIGQHITSLQLEYVLTIAILNRMVQCGVRQGYSFPLGSEVLRIASQSILVPDLIGKYLECVGLVEHNNIKFVPWVSNYHDMMATRHYRDPKKILEEAERPIPNNIWKVDRSWITEYNLAISRVTRLRLGLRMLTEGTLGRNELLVGYRATDDYYIPIAPVNLSHSEFQLGSTYKFRCYDQQREWPGLDNYSIPPLFTSEIVDPDLTVATLLSESLASRNYMATH